MEQNAKLRRAISLIIESGYQIDSDTFQILKEASERVDIEHLVRSIIEDAKNLQEKSLFLSRKLIEKKISEFGGQAQTIERTFTTGKNRYRPYAKEIESEVKILKNPAENISTKGSLENYIKYFQDRFRRIQKILRRRMNSVSSGSIIQALKAPPNSKVGFTCMLIEKRDSSSGIFLHVEDLEMDAKVFVSSQNPELYRKAQRLMLDQVIFISCLLYTSPSPRDRTRSRMPSSA